ncbi:MAG: 2-phosphosulfolactate phosphatase [Bacteroidales bacterium]|nr:2-phosphosulfolactate phosphatase [Bacteroidales bacterium]
MDSKRTVEVAFSPVLYPYRITREDFVVVIVDVLRATTSITAAFENGVSEIIPVGSVEEARKWKERGFLVASERDGKKLDFADFGNSAFSFMTDQVKGQTIAYSTTNGTQAIEMANGSGQEVVIGAFNNLTVVSDWLVAMNKNVVVLCSGYKNKFNLEDSFFAGAITDNLVKSGDYTIECDSATVARDMWLAGKDNMEMYINKASHRERLRNRGQDNVLEYTFTIDNVRALPLLRKEDKRLYNASLNKD